MQQHFSAIPQPRSPLLQVFNPPGASLPACSSSCSLFRMSLPLAITPSEKELKRDNGQQSTRVLLLKHSVLIQRQYQLPVTFLSLPVPLHALFCAAAGLSTAAPTPSSLGANSVTRRAPVAGTGGFPTPCLHTKIFSALLAGFLKTSSPPRLTLLRNSAVDGGPFLFFLFGLPTKSILVFSFLGSNTIMHASLTHVAIIDV